MGERDAHEVGGWVRVVKAARELLQWNQQDLADEAEVGVATLRRFEAGAPVKEETLAKMLDALERAGAVFLEPARIGRHVLRDGVALKTSARPKPRGRRPDAKSRTEPTSKR